MKKTYYVLLCLLVLILFPNTYTWATQLSTWHMSNSIDCSWLKGYGPTDQNKGYFAIFDARVWTDFFRDIHLTENQGQTFWVRSNNDNPYFSSAASLLTNNTESAVRLYYYGIGPEQYDSVFRPQGSNKYDLAGYKITGIGLRINSINYTIVDYGTYYQKTGSYSIDALIEYEPVPEPSSIIVLLSGIAGLGGLALQCRK